MNKFVLIILANLIHLSCSSDVLSDRAKQSIKVKEHVVLEFLVDNSNPDSIGYEVWEMDENIGVKAISIHDGHIYITDVYHSNIKKISINNGSMMSSVSISNLPPSKSGVWLRDISSFNNKLYVTSDRDSIYVFSEDLRYEEAIECVKGRKTIFNVGDDSLFIYLGETQLENKDIEFDLMYIGKNDRISQVSKTLSIEEYGRKNSFKETLGKRYKVFIEDGKSFVETENGTIKIEGNIPVINDYDARNIDFDNNHLVYFDSTPSKLILHIYQFSR